MLQLATAQTTSMNTEKENKIAHLFDNIVENCIFVTEPAETCFLAAASANVFGEVLQSAFTKVFESLPDEFASTRKDVQDLQELTANDDAAVQFAQSLFYSCARLHGKGNAANIEKLHVPNYTLDKEQVQVAQHCFNMRALLSVTDKHAACVLASSALDAHVFAEAVRILKQRANAQIMEFIGEMEMLRVLVAKPSNAEHLARLTAKCMQRHEQQKL